MTYHIKKGQHRSGFHLKFRKFAEKTTFNILFDKNCLYPILETDDYDINKLCGYSFMTFKKLPPHHSDSVRVGWRPTTDGKTIDLFFYLYNEGKRTCMDFFAIVKTDKNYRLSIVHLANKSLMFILTDSNGLVLATAGKDFKLPNGLSRNGYMLYPFFGGDKVAPNDMSIDVSLLP